MHYHIRGKFNFFKYFYKNKYGRVAKWLERLTAEQNIDGSSRALGSYLGCSPTVHPAANGYLVATLGKLKVAREETGHPTSLCQRLRMCPSNGRVVLHTQYMVSHKMLSSK